MHSTTICSGRGYTASGKNVVENKNMGSVAKMMKSKSFQLRM